MLLICTVKLTVEPHTYHSGYPSPVPIFQFVCLARNFQPASQHLPLAAHFSHRRSTPLKLPCGLRFRMPPARIHCPNNIVYERLLMTNLVFGGPLVFVSCGIIAYSAHKIGDIRQSVCVCHRHPLLK